MSEPTPPHAAPYDSFPFPERVTLRTSITVNGTEYGYQQLVPRHDWEAIRRDPALRAEYEHLVRRRLGEIIAERLAPPVTVHGPSPAEDFVAYFTRPDMIGSTS